MSETTLAFLVVKKSEEGLSTSEVWPKDFGEIQFGIRNLPKKKIADSRLTACANQEVGIGKISSGKILFELAFGYDPRNFSIP